MELGFFFLVRMLLWVRLKRGNNSQEETLVTKRLYASLSGDWSRHLFPNLRSAGHEKPQAQIQSNVLLSKHPAGLEIRDEQTLRF